MLDGTIFRRFTLLVVSLLLVGGVAGIVGCAPAETEQPATTVPAPAPEDEGSEIPEIDADRALVESRCSGCHTLDQVWAVTEDRAGWESIVSRMEANGLSITGEERTSIIDYLAAQ